MASLGDVAKLKRDIVELEEQISVALRGKMRDTDRRSLRSEIEVCMQRLDELRNRLAG
jgi:hypothetical protein